MIYIYIRTVLVHDGFIKSSFWHRGIIEVITILVGVEAATGFIGDV